VGRKEEEVGFCLFCIVDRFEIECFVEMGRNSHLKKKPRALEMQSEKISTPAIVGILSIAAVLVLRYLGESGMVKTGQHARELAFEEFMNSNPALWDRDLHEVVDELTPVTHLDFPFEATMHLTTHNFKEYVLSQPEDTVVIVVFYDPRSSSFVKTHQEIEKAAEIVRESADLKDKIIIGTLNAGIDSFLAFKYVSFWNSEKELLGLSGLSFQFGRDNARSMLTRAFRGGQVISAFKGVYEAEDFVRYAVSNLQAGTLTIVKSEADAVEEIKKLARIPAVVGCGKRVEKEDFELLQSRFATRSAFIFISDDDCSTCALISYDLTGKRHCYEASELLSASAEKWVRRMTRGQGLEQLRKDNIDVYVERPLIFVFLLDPENVDHFRRISRLVSGIVNDESLGSLADHVDFVWADSQERAEAYGLNPSLANILLFQTSLLAEGEQDAVYLPPDKKPGSTKPDLLDENVGMVKESVISWFKFHVQDELQDIILDHRAFLKVDGIEKVKKAAGSALNQAESQKSRPKADETKARKEEWEPEQFSQANALTFFMDLPPEKILGSFRHLYAEYARLEELWETMSAEKRIDEMILGNKLEAIRNFMRQKEFLHEYIHTIPLTPARLRERAATRESRRKLLRSIERLDANLIAVTNSMVESPERSRVKAEWAEACHFLEYFLYKIYNDRGTHHRQERGWNGTTIETLEIERRSAKNLTMEDFFRDFASKGRPVIIQGAEMFNKHEWDLDHIKNMCGQRVVDLAMVDRSAKSWGGLVRVPAKLTMSEYIDTFRQVEERKSWYVHDWSLPANCDEVFGEPPFDEFRFPKYFAGDYFQRVPFDGYQHTWPSLFIGANGTQSLMHVDSGGTNFWMFLVSGAKEWRFFERSEIPNLYSRPLSSAFAADPFVPDFERLPLIERAKMYRGIQKPGDLIFIPGGSPHGVKNLDDIIALSMNYVDDSNLWLYLWTQLHNADFRSFETMSNPNMPRGLRKDQQDLTFGDFKSTDWFELKVNGKLDLLDLRKA